jgi:hypothetical protein
MSARDDTRSGERRAVAACPECAAPVDVSRHAFAYVDIFGEWNGVEDCRECSTALAFTVRLDDDRQVVVMCDRL